MRAIGMTHLPPPPLLLPVLGGVRGWVGATSPRVGVCAGRVATGGPYSLPAAATGLPAPVAVAVPFVLLVGTHGTGVRVAWSPLHGGRGGGVGAPAKPDGGGGGGGEKSATVGVNANPVAACAVDAVDGDMGVGVEADEDVDDVDTEEVEVSVVVVVVVRVGGGVVVFGWVGGGGRVVRAPHVQVEQLLGSKKYTAALVRSKPS